MAGEVTYHLTDLYSSSGYIDPTKLLSNTNPFKNLHLSSTSVREENVFGKAFKLINLREESDISSQQFNAGLQNYLNLF